jgi:hypothetical protein
LVPRYGSLSTSLVHKSGLFLHPSVLSARLSSALSKPNSPEVTVSGSALHLGDISGVGSCSGLGAANV